MGSGTWKLVGVNAMGSATEGINDYPSYLYKSSESMAGCQKACIARDLCIGLTFWGKSSYLYCYLWLMKKGASGVGWSWGTGREGMLPKDLKVGQPQQEAYKIVTYARSGHKPSISTAAPVTAGLFATFDALMSVLTAFDLCVLI